MTKELKSCPFCGGEAHIHTHERYGIECDNNKCGMGLACICDTEEEAINRWNRREPIDEIITKLESRFMAEENRFRMGVYLDVIEMLKGASNETD